LAERSSGAYIILLNLLGIKKKGVISLKKFMVFLVVFSSLLILSCDLKKVKVVVGEDVYLDIFDLGVLAGVKAHMQDSTLNDDQYIKIARQITIDIAKEKNAKLTLQWLKPLE
jgi:hypothetical protein